MMKTKIVCISAMICALLSLTVNAQGIESIAESENPMIEFIRTLSIDLNPERSEMEIRLIESKTGIKVLTIASYEVVGREEGMYKVRFFDFKDGKDIEKWNSDMKIQDAVFWIEDNWLHMGSKEFGIDQRVEFNSQKYSRLQRNFNQSSYRFFENMNYSENIETIEAESFDMIDCDKDGSEEIVISNPIYYKPTWSYITSIYSVWKIENGEVKLEKSFVIDRKGIVGETTKEIIEYACPGFTKR